MAKFFDTLPIKPELIPHDRYIAGTGGEALRPVDKCFIPAANWKRRVFRDRVVVIENLRHKYILGQVLHRLNQFGTGYIAAGKHYITINWQVIATSDFTKP